MYNTFFSRLPLLFISTVCIVVELFFSHTHYHYRVPDWKPIISYLAGSPPKWTMPLYYWRRGPILEFGKPRRIFRANSVRNSFNRLWKEKLKSRNGCEKTTLNKFQINWVCIYMDVWNGFLQYFTNTLLHAGIDIDYFFHRDFHCYNITGKVIIYVCVAHQVLIDFLVFFANKQFCHFANNTFWL